MILHPGEILLVGTVCGVSLTIPPYIYFKAEIMKRLEELELQELRNGEIDHCTDNKGGPFVSKLMNLNGDDTKCLTSMMTLHATKDDFSQSSVVQFPTNSIEFPNTCKNQETPTSSTQVESFVATTKENLTENEVYDDDVRHDFSTDAFHGEELVEMLTNQEEDYDENVHAYKPPRGINVEDYQKLLRVIESINSEGSDSDRISEESNESYKEVEQMDEEGSELDSDDITDAEFQNKDYIPSPFVEKVKSNITVANVNDRIEVKGECDNLSAKVSQNEEKLKRNPMRKKKKAVVFAENLEDATLIDKNAPPCDVRASTACTSKTQPKKILTNCDEKSPVDEQAVMNVRSEKANCSYAFRDTSTAFTGVFQEKNLDYLASDCDQTIVTEPVKRQSLFKIKSRNNL
ncbi:hypothetical protein DICVIV_11331 [Dictyocaulus viviparus]|uniref:Uncharacterized protein n=1 Tax=Dictyocaulus viviparus TaxID=29172 RepID=A0A0D8XDK2_DICVI|nr:hypothetical protein DICVIV_11331 [Dictyocaulus viviparus]